MDAHAGISMYHYEGHDTTKYNIPTAFVEVLVCNYGNRGIALAIDWRNDQPHTLWVNARHDSWGSWTKK